VTAGENHYSTQSLPAEWLPIRNWKKRMKRITRKSLKSSAFPFRKKDGCDLDSLYCYLLAAERHRDAETWAIHLLDLKAQGLHPDDTLADGARG
jgi:hypothetical protein